MVCQAKGVDRTAGGSGVVGSGVGGSKESWELEFRVRMGREAHNRVANRLRRSAATTQRPAATALKDVTDTVVVFKEPPRGAAKSVRVVCTAETTIPQTKENVCRNPKLRVSRLAETHEVCGSLAIERPLPDDHPCVAAAVQRVRMMAEAAKRDIGFSRVEVGLPTRAEMSSTHAGAIGPRLHMLIPQATTAVHACWDDLQWVVCRTKPCVLLANCHHTSAGDTAAHHVPHGAAVVEAPLSTLPPAVRNTIHPSMTVVVAEGAQQPQIVAVRERSRRSWQLHHGLVVADLTVVTTNGRGRAYELELEVDVERAVTLEPSYVAQVVEQTLSYLLR